MGRQTINVEEIIAELRQETRLKDMADIESFEEIDCLDLSDGSGLEEFNRDELLREMGLANGSYIISPEVELEGKCKFIKRIVRKFTYFLVRQFAERLTEYNTHMIRSLNQIRNYIFCRYEDDNAVGELKSLVVCDVTAKVTAQSSRIRLISKENMELRQQIAKCTGLLEEYRRNAERAGAQIELMQIKIETLEKKYRLLSQEIDK
jgi:hypothetical protein